MKCRILIAENHRVLRRGLRSLISALPDFEVIGDCEGGEETLRLALQLAPDLILMDLSLPGLSGIEATAQIKRRLPKIKIAALCSHKSDEYVREALRAGADAYILQDASYDELVMALRRVAGGKRFLSPDVSAHLAGNYRGTRRAEAKATPWDTLTARERSILQLIAQGRTNRATAEFLHVSPKTVEKHRANLMRKLGLHKASELTLVAREQGLIERPAAASRLPGIDAPLTRRDGQPGETPTLGP